MNTTNEIKLTFPGLFNETLRKYGKRNAYAFVGEEPKTYESADREIRALIAFLEENGIRPGDKVAILSLNMPNWGIAFFSITFMGAVVVPVLPDFSPVEIANILEHSGAKAIFISNSLLSRIEDFKSDILTLSILIEDFSILTSGKDRPRYDPSVLSVKN
jgi:long-chain acyl-CoA synthetase